MEETHKRGSTLSIDVLFLKSVSIKGMYYFEYYNKSKIVHFKNTINTQYGATKKNLSSKS